MSMHRRRTDQKFDYYDLVSVASDLGDCMRHFPGAGEQAIVCGSYRDQYGGGNQDRKIYTLLFKDHGRSSWYNEHQLTFVDENRPDLYQKWRRY